MKIFYYSSFEDQIPLIAGWIHLNRLPVDRIPTMERLNDLLKSELKSNKQTGIPKFIGEDEYHNEIFLIDFGNDPNLGLQTAYFLLKEHSNLLEWKFFDIRIQPNSFLQLGRILSKLRLTGFGQRLMIRGIQSCYSEIAGQVIQTKELCKNCG